MKNLLKSIFISTFPVFAIYILITSSLQLYNNGFSIHYLGNLLSAGTVVFFFAGLFLISQARTSKNLILFSSLIGLGFLLNVFSIVTSENPNLFEFATITTLIILWILYLKWYSVFEERETNLLKVGNLLPSFEVETISKKSISSETFKGNSTIYLFYRGNWCPLCMAQIKEIAAKYKELEKRGVIMNFISPQPHHYSKTLTDKYQLNFNFLTDADNKVSKQLGIFSENGIPAGFQVFGFDSDTVLPTVIITDKNGKIIFADLTDNYRVRPEPETFLRVLDGI